MKKKFLPLVLILCMFFIAGLMPASADSLVPILGNSIGTNPQYFTANSPEVEQAWLAGLLGLPIDDPSIAFISKDEDEDNPLDNVPAEWMYAILKYGVGKPPADSIAFVGEVQPSEETNPNHWAIVDDNENNILELGGIEGLPGIDRLSHVTYFGSPGSPPPPPPSVPEPATLLLLGVGLVGLAGASRKFKK